MLQLDVEGFAEPIKQSVFAVRREPEFQAGKRALAGSRGAIRVRGTKQDVLNLRM